MILGTCNLVLVVTVLLVVAAAVQELYQRTFMVQDLLLVAV